jgi:hypothetical protein
MMSFLSYPGTFQNPNPMVLLYLIKITIVQAHALCEDNKWDYQGFSYERFREEKEYRARLYPEQQQSIRKFHKELIHKFVDYEESFHLKKGTKRKRE